MLKFLSNFIFILVLLLLETSIFTLLPFFAHINFILLFVVYLALKNDKHFMMFAIITGYFLDVFSSHTFGIHIVAMLTTAFLCHYIYFNLLTNHRFLPIVFLISAAILFYNFFIYVMIYLLGFLKLFPNLGIAEIEFGKNFEQILYSLIFISILYVIYRLIQKKIKTKFLSTR